MRVCAIQFIWTGDPRSGETLGVSAPLRLCSLRTLVARSRPTCRGTPRRGSSRNYALIDRSFDGSIVPYTSDRTRRAERSTGDLRWSGYRKSRATESRGNRAFESRGNSTGGFKFSASSRRRYLRRFRNISMKIRIFGVGRSRHVHRYSICTRVWNECFIRIDVYDGYDGASLSFDDWGEWGGNYSEWVRTWPEQPDRAPKIVKITDV